MRFAYAYAVFLDDNNLPRIDAAPEVHLANLDKLAVAVLAERKKYLDQIERRCPTCGSIRH